MIEIDICFCLLMQLVGWVLVGMKNSRLVGFLE